jgi:hypothetical protein
LFFLPLSYPQFFFDSRGSISATITMEPPGVLAVKADVMRSLTFSFFYFTLLPSIFFQFTRLYMGDNIDEPPGSASMAAVVRSGFSFFLFFLALFPFFPSIYASQSQRLYRSLPRECLLRRRRLCFFLPLFYPQFSFPRLSFNLRVSISTTISINPSVVLTAKAVRCH